jgi:hypothetical protein
VVLDTLAIDGIQTSPTTSSRGSGFVKVNYHKILTSSLHVFFLRYFTAVFHQHCFCFAKLGDSLMGIGRSRKDAGDEVDLDCFKGLNWHSTVLM